jgi:hypothetical protein
MGVGLIAAARRRASAMLGALVHKSTGDQAIGVTFVTSTWDTEIYDLAGWHDAVSNTSRLTVPSGVSFVRVISSILASAPVVLQHLKNGATFAGMGKGDVSMGTGSNLLNIASAPIAVSAGDYFQTQIGKETSGTITPSNDPETWFAIEALPASLKYALVAKSSSQSVAANTTTAITFDTEIADTDGFHDNVTNPSRLTIPAALNGKAVRVCANICGGSVAGQLDAFLLKGGVAVPGLPARDAETANEENISLMSAPLEVVTGDYFEIGVFFATATTVPSADNVWFSIEEVPSTIQRALVTKSAGQSLSAGVSTVLTWNQETYDTASIHDNATNNSRLTVPAGCTKARPTAKVTNTSTAGRLNVFVLLNGVTYFGMAEAISDTAGADECSAAGAWVDVSPGDYFEAFVFTDNATTIGTSSWFALECQ